MINTGVDLAVLNILIAISHRGRSGVIFSLFKAISFLVAVTNSYFMNGRWTFAQKAFQSDRLLRFLLVSLAGLLMNVGVASAVANWIDPAIGLERAWPSVAAVAGTICGLAVNFAGYRHLVFLSRPKPSRVFREQTCSPVSLRARR